MGLKKNEASTGVHGYSTGPLVPVESSVRTLYEENSIGTLMCESCSRLVVGKDVLDPTMLGKCVGALVMNKKTPYGSLTGSVTRHVQCCERDGSVFSGGDVVPDVLGRKAVLSGCLLRPYILRKILRCFRICDPV